MKTSIYWQDPKYAVGRRFTDPSCVLYLPLHRLDGAGFKSEDAYGHLCAVTGALWRSSGRYFDGTDDIITIADHTVLQLTTRATFEFAFKLTSIDRNQNLISKASGSSNYGIKIHPTSNLIRLDWFNVSWQSALSNTAMDTNWHIIAVAVDFTLASANISFYIDGILDVARDNTTSFIASADDVTLGREAEATAHLDGTIGEVRIYRRALTPTEVQHNYLATKWRYQ